MLQNMFLTNITFLFILTTANKREKGIVEGNRFREKNIDSSIYDKCQQRLVD